MRHPLSRYAASPALHGASLLAAQGRGAYGQPATPSRRGGAAGLGPSSVSLAFRGRRFCEQLLARSAMDN